MMKIKMRHFLGVLATTVGVAIWLNGAGSDPGNQPDTPRIDANLAAATQPIARGGSASAGQVELGIPSWTGFSERQSYTVLGGKHVVVTNHTLNGMTSTWSGPHVYRGTTSATFVDSASAGMNRFCFGGFADNGMLIIEGWVLGSPPGGGGGGGSGSGGGPLQQAQPTLIFDKTRIYTGTAGSSGLYAMDYDREGRFVLVLVDSGAGKELIRFDAVQDATPQLIDDVSTLPDLAHVNRIYRVNHQVLGRTWILTSAIESYAHGIIYVDADNDGSFDGAPILGSYSDLEAAGLEGPSMWDHQVLE